MSERRDHLRAWLAELLPERARGLRAERERDRSERATLQRARRRQAMVFVVAALVLAILLGRTAYWTLAQHQALAARAEKQQLATFPVPAGRGAILDANGRILALSVTQDTVIADPVVIRSAGGLPAAATALAGLVGLPADLVLHELDVPGEYTVIRDAAGATLLLSQEQSDTVAAAIAGGKLAGVALIPQVRRVDPEGALAAQALGFVSLNDGKGAYGVEQQEEQELAGQPGLISAAHDAQGHPLASTIRSETPPVPGASVTLTLDATVQYWAEQGLAQTVASAGADGGTLIVMDPRTGGIVAMASLPSFDPNAYGQSSLDRFPNPAVSAVYDPGSVMKALTMAAGVDAGAIAPDSVFHDTGTAVVDGQPLHNWANRAYGDITMTQVLQYSVNTGAVWAQQQVGRDRFERYLDAFGFGKPTGVDLPAEAAGLRGASNGGYSALTAAENAFGEGIAVTPLQMVAAYGALANGGVLMRPHIVASVAAGGDVTSYGAQAVRQVVSADTARTVTQMLVDSARVSEAQMNLIKGYTVAAKTGTSTPDPNNPSVTYASVIGYAPASDPRFVLLVKLDHPKPDIFGGSTAGPLWRALAQQLFVYYRIPPDRAG
jgi:cell division protein FtsI/penicillin-binding protein 2